MIWYKNLDRPAFNRPQGARGGRFCETNPKPRQALAFSLQEALQFAGDGKVHATTATAKLDDINDVFARMHTGKIEGRIVLDMNA